MVCDVGILDGVDVLGPGLGSEDGEDAGAGADIEDDLAVEELLGYRRKRSTLFLVMAF